MVSPQDTRGGSVIALALAHPEPPVAPVLMTASTGERNTVIAEVVVAAALATALILLPAVEAAAKARILHSKDDSCKRDGFSSTERKHKKHRKHSRKHKVQVNCHIPIMPFIGTHSSGEGGLVLPSCSRLLLGGDLEGEA